MAYPSVKRKEDVPKETPIAQVPAEDEVFRRLTVTGDEKEPPVLLGKDEAFDAELESVYRHAMVEPVLHGETSGKEAFEETRTGAEETRKEEPGDLGEGPSMDFIPLNALDDEKDALEREMEPSADAAVSRKRSSKSGWLAVLLVILLVLLAGVAAITYWKPELIQPYLSLLRPPEKQKPVDAGVRLLQFESVAGSFVDSDKGGQLFVIRGMVRSEYPKPRSYILVRGSILDSRGKLVESKVSYAGNTFTKEELKTLPLEEIQKAMKNRDGMARQNFNLPSGATIPFMIVFDNLPENLSEFAVEAVSSSPGT